MTNNAKLLSDHFKGLQRTIVSMPDEAPIKALCQSFLDDAKCTLSDLQNVFPQANELVGRLALELASLATCVSNYYATEIYNEKAEAGELCRIANSVSALYTDVARAKANQFWEADKNQEFRVGEVAKLVHDIMRREGYFSTNQRGKVTPTVGTVRNWIAFSAPDYGRRHGRD